MDFLTKKKRYTILLSYTKKLLGKKDLSVNKKKKQNLYRE